MTPFKKEGEMKKVISLAKESACEPDVSATLAEVVDLFNKGALKRLYIVAQGADGMINEYEFNGRLQEACPLAA